MGLPERLQQFSELTKPGRPCTRTTYYLARSQGRSGSLKGSAPHPELLFWHDRSQARMGRIDRKTFHDQKAT